MKTHLHRGTTAQNNALVLPEGMLSIDSEKKAIRIHDGVTPGGYEAVGVRAYGPPVGPGPTELVAGTQEHGYYGTLSAEEFITATALSDLVGISEGTLGVDDTAWFKLALDGKILYIPQRALRYNLSWSTLYSSGVVYGVEGPGRFPINGSTDQSTMVTIQGERFRVRLPRGANVDPSSGTPSTNPEYVQESEWNKLYYPLLDSPLNTYGWANYHPDTFGFNSSTSGMLGWCQEQYQLGSGLNRVLRGSTEAARYTYGKATVADHQFAWRPVLEYVPPET